MKEHLPASTCLHVAQLRALVLEHWHHRGDLSQRGRRLAGGAARRKHRCQCISVGRKLAAVVRIGVQRTRQPAGAREDGHEVGCFAQTPAQSGEDLCEQDNRDGKFSEAV